MKLRFSPTSPFVRKVMAVAHCTGQVDTIDKIPTTTNDADLSDDNPLGKVPVVRLDDGSPLYDSPVICEYLDSRHDGAKLFPDPGPARWTALRLQAMGDGIMDSCVALVVESRRTPEQQSEGWIDRQTGKIRKTIEALEDDVDVLSGPLTIGVLTAGIALSYADRRVPDMNWRALAPKLAAWHEAFAKNDFMTATEPPPA